MFFLYTILYRTIATAHVNEVALLGRCADTTAVRRVRGRATSRLGLVIAEDEQVIRTQLNLGAEQRLIGCRVTPCADVIAGRQLHVIKGTHRLIGVLRTTRVFQEVARKTLLADGRVHAVYHHNVCNQEQNETR